MTSAQHRWIEDAETAVFEWILAAPPLEESALDAAILALNRGGYLRLVVDLHPPSGEPRLRVRVIERVCGWWIADSWGRVAPALDAGATSA